MIRLSLASYDPSWPRQFDDHRRRIGSALGDRCTRIEHIGSTSVPDLAAKPVIDILVQGASHDDPAVCGALEHAGYALTVEEPGHRMFADAGRRAHVHLWEDAAEAEKHVVFRDWLRSHPDDRMLYEHVKRILVERDWETCDRYTDAKTAVVRTILRRANGEMRGPRIERFAQLLRGRLPQHARILEIGAGEGVLAQTLARAAYGVVAIDTDIRSTFPIVQTSFEAFECPPGTFDCVTAQLVLHHVTDLRAALGKIESVLRGGGIVAVDDYGWERSGDPQFRADRADLRTSEELLEALRGRFTEIYYGDHAHFADGAGEDSLGFTFIGRRR